MKIHKLIYASFFSILASSTVFAVEGPSTPAGPGNSGAATLQQELGSQPSCRGDEISYFATLDGRSVGEVRKGNEGNITQGLSDVFFFGLVVGLSNFESCSDSH